MPVWNPNAIDYDREDKRIGCWVTTIEESRAIIEARRHEWE